MSEISSGSGREPEAATPIAGFEQQGDEVKVEVYDNTLSPEEVERLKKYANSVLFDGEVILEFTEPTEGDDA